MKLIYKALKTIFKPKLIEINEKSGFDIGQFHVSQQLGLVKRKELLHSFKFENYLIFNQYINPVTAVKANSLVFNRQSLLKFKTNVLSGKLISKALFISGFQQAWAKVFMNFNRTADYFIGNIIKSFHTLKLPLKNIFSTLRGSSCSSWYQKNLEINHG